MKIKLSLTTQIAAALVLAIITGVLLQGHSSFANEFIKPFGTIFLNLLKFIVVPLVLFSIMSGILSMNDMSKLGKLGLRAILYFAFTTVIAVTLGLVVSTLVSGWIPSINLHIEKTGKELGMPEVSFMDQFVNMFPDNILTPLSTMAMIQVIVIAILFGVAIVHVAEKGNPTRNLVLSLNEVVEKVLYYIMAVAPVGVFCMLTPVVVNNGPSVLGSYAVLVVLAYSCFLIHVLCVYSPLVYFLGGLSPFRFLKEMQSALLFPFSSDSSVATLPYSMECTEKLGVDKSVGSFVLSLGATINMDGAAVTITVMTLAVCNTMGIPVDIPTAILLSVLATLGACGASGVAGGSLLLIPLACSLFGINNDVAMQAVGVGFIIGVIQDSVETALNSSGDVIFTATAEYHDRMKAGEPVNYLGKSE